MYSLAQSHQLLLKYSIRPSVQRTMVMDYLLNNRNHPSVDEIFSVLIRTMPTLSRTTIYNSLNLFVARGAVRVLVIDEKNARYDVDISLHAHFLCKECGKVYDILNIRKELFEVPEMQDLEIETVEISYKGICKNCRH
ncbi:MAG: transcriptional repressor [Prevotellaceae bacterium]|nr:transcriptional repressor [Prevotellaceae bacterium]